MADTQFPDVCFLGKPQEKEVAAQSEPVSISPPGLGITLKIPPNAVKEPVKVSVRACLSSSAFQYPEGWTPLSAMYHISSDSAFDKPFELKFEHFADLKTDAQVSDMTFFSAKSHGKGKYAFTPMEGGVFKVNDHRCTISTKQVGFFCAGSRQQSEICKRATNALSSQNPLHMLPIGKRYTVLCSYTNQIEDERHVSVAVSLDNAVYITVSH